MALVVLLVAAAWLVLNVRSFRAEWDDVAPRSAKIAPAGTAGIDGLVDVAIERIGGGILRAWFLPAHNGVAIVLAHGSGGDRTQMLEAARVLAAEGFGVLVYDAPGCGASDGAKTLGQDQVEAARAAFRWVSGQPGVRRVGALGFSLGAQSLALAAAEEPEVRALVLEAPPADVVELLRREYGWLAMTGALVASYRGGWRPGDRGVLDVAPRLAGRPLLVARGSEDQVLPVAKARRLREAMGASSWDVAGVGHMPLGKAVAADEYARKVGGFFRQALGGVRASAQDAVPGDGDADRVPLDRR